MKQILLALGLAVSMSAAAQDHGHHHSYQKSVFEGYELVPIANIERHAQTRAAAKANFPGWKLDIDKITGSFSNVYGDAISVNGNSPLQKSQTVMNERLKGLGINAAEWKLTRDFKAPKAHYIDYEQSLDGRKVEFSKLSFRFTTDGRLVRVKARSFGNTIKHNAPVLTASDVKASAKITEDISGVFISIVEVAGDWVWFPVPSPNGYTLQPAWAFTAKGMEGERMPVELHGFIDGVTGELLYRSNEVKEFEVQAKANVYKQNTITPATLEPMGNIEVVIGGNASHANDTGLVSDPAASANVTFRLKGLWSTVVPQGNSTPEYTDLITGTGNVFVFPDTGWKSRAVNAYYHTNRAHDNMKALLPGFTGMDVSLTTNVELTSSTCNAFYNGSSINFYAPGGGCPSFAEIGDIVYHEYGHGINRTFYADQGASTMRNGALNEGYADVWAMTITQDSILGRNSKGAPTTFIRRYDADHKVYPENIIGEVHADGEIIAGAWWDVARNTGSYETMAQIFADAFYDLADGPNGMEGPVFHDVLVSAILSDDNDATLSNGTPNFHEIVTAFAKHGIYMYGNAEVVHQELAHQPHNTPITVNASLNITNSDFFQGLMLYYRNRTAGSWDSVLMTNNGSFNFTAQIPGQPQGSLVDYYFYIYDYLAIPTVSFPSGYRSDATMAIQSTIPYQFAVGVTPRIQITFDEEMLEDDWQIGLDGDNATSGKWVQAKPVGTFYSPHGGAFGQFITQVAKDHTSGSGQCLVTGNGPTNYTSGDVDRGRTTVITQEFDLTSYVYPIVEYYRWYSNDRAGSFGESTRRNDLWRAEIGLATSSGWKIVENTYQADHNWRRRVFAVDQYLPGIRNIRMRFTASDNVVGSTSTSGQSVVEAAIDDFFIYDGVPTSVEDITPVKAQIYPNPADERVTISMPTPAKGTIELFDVTGKAIYQVQMDGISNKYTINTSNLAAGQYMLLIKGDNKTIQSNKLIVTHK